METCRDPCPGIYSEGGHTSSISNSSSNNKVGLLPAAGRLGSDVGVAGGGMDDDVAGLGASSS